VYTGPISPDCATLVERAGFTFSNPNDREQLRSGRITRVIKDSAGSAIGQGETYTITPQLCAMLNALASSGIPVNMNSIIGGHDIHVAGTSRTSPHIQGRGADLEIRNWRNPSAADTEHNRRLGAWLHTNRERLGITQIIVNQPYLNEFNYNEGKGSGTAAFPNGIPAGHHNHFHITTRRP